MNWSTSLSESFANVTQTMATYVPRLLVAVAVLALGWLVGQLFRMLATRLVARVDRLGSGGAIGRELRASGMERLAPQMIGGAAFWVVFLFFFAAAIEVAGFQVVTTSLGRLVQYLPSVFAAILVVLAGVVLGNLGRRGVARAVAGAGLDHGELLGRVARIATLLVAIVIALDQIGIESTLLIITLAILLGTFVGAAALAFGLGARRTVQGFIAAHYAGQRYRPGDHIRIGDLAGRIIEFTPTAVLLDTPEGQTMVPASEFDRATSTLLTDGTAP